MFPFTHQIKTRFYWLSARLSESGFIYKTVEYCIYNKFWLWYLIFWNVQYILCKKHPIYRGLCYYFIVQYTCMHYLEVYRIVHVEMVLRGVGFKIDRLKSKCKKYWLSKLSIYIAFWYDALVICLQVLHRPNGVHYVLLNMQLLEIQRSQNTDSLTRTWFEEANSAKLMP